jgi:tetratricopeptide (TPR) repeat protein
LGNTYFACNLYEKGWEAYAKAMTVNNFASVFALAMQQHNYGLQYFQTNKYAAALPYFERSLEIIPDYLSSSIHIAKIKLLQGKTAEARKAIQHSLKYHPQNVKLLEMASLISFKENNFHEADKTAKIALQKNPSAALGLKIRAEIARKNGNYRGSIILWNLYKNIVPDSVEANLALIELYNKMNEKTLLKKEISKLNCFRQIKSYNDYIDEFSKAKYFFVYSPNKTKIIEIVRNINL